MFDYHISFSNGLYYCFAFDEFKHPCGRYKSPSFSHIISWIMEREQIDEGLGHFITESWSSL